MIQFFKELFCIHKYKTIKSDTYNVIDKNDFLEGTVILSVRQCEKCLHTKIIPHNRKHYRPRISYKA